MFALHQLYAFANKGLTSSLGQIGGRNGLGGVDHVCHDQHHTLSVTLLAMFFVVCLALTGLPLAFLQQILKVSTQAFLSSSFSAVMR